MLQFLGRLLTSNRGAPPSVRYLNKAEADAIWREGRLLAVDPQGATFETVVSGVPLQNASLGAQSAQSASR